MTIDLEEEQDPPSFKAARKKDKERLQKVGRVLQFSFFRTNTAASTRSLVCLCVLVTSFMLQKNYIIRNNWIASGKKNKSIEFFLKEPRL